MSPSCIVLDEYVFSRRAKVATACVLARVQATSTTVGTALNLSSRYLMQLCPSFGTISGAYPYRLICDIVAGGSEQRFDMYSLLRTLDYGNQGKRVCASIARFRANSLPWTRHYLIAYVIDVPVLRRPCLRSRTQHIFVSAIIGCCIHLYRSSAPACCATGLTFLSLPRKTGYDNVGMTNERKKAICIYILVHATKRLHHVFAMF